MATQTEERILQLTSNRAINNQLLAEQKLKAQNNGNQKILDSQTTESDKKPFGARVWETTFDVFGNIAYGAAKGLEGIVDFAANITGVFGDEDYKEKVKDFVQNNWTEENLSIIKDNKITDDSYLKDASETAQKIGYGVSQGIGQMLPSIALAAATAGIGGAVGASSQAVSTASQVASLGSLGLSAAGSSTESAYAENDAEYGMATLYGALSGAVEIATEKLFGGIEKLGITGIADDVVDSAISKITKSVNGDKFIKALADLGEEGIEEMISEFIDPYLQRATINPDAENATPQEILEAGLIGALTAAAMNGTSSIARNATTKGRATEALNNAEIAVNTYNELLLKENVTESELQHWRNQAETYFKNAESLMSSISEEKKLKYLKDNLGSKSVTRRENARFLNKYFNQDGTLKEGTYMTAKEVENAYNNRIANAKLGINDNLKSENVAGRIAKVEGLNLQVSDIVESKDLTDGAKAWMKENNDNYNVPTIVIKDSVFKAQKNDDVKTFDDNMGNALAFYSRNADAIFIKQSAANDFTNIDKNASIEITAHYIVKGMHGDDNAIGTYGNRNGNKIYNSVTNILNESIKNHDGLADTVADIMVQRGLAQYVDKDGNVVNEDIDEWRKKNPDVELSVEAKKNKDGTIDWDVYNQEIVDSFIKVIYNGEDNFTLLHHLVNNKLSFVEKLAQYIKDVRLGITHKRSDFYKMYRKNLKEIEKLLDTAIEYRDEDVNTFAIILRDSIDGDDDAEQEDTIEINGEKVPDITKTEVTWNRNGKNVLISNLQFRQFEQKDIEFVTKTLDDTAVFLHKWAKQYGLEDLDKNLLTDIQYSNAKNRDGVVRQVLSALVKNGDYPVNFDLSTRCKKRKYFQKVIETMAIQGFFDKYVYNENDLIAIRKALQENGYEVPCAMCFVENRRLQQGNWAYDIVYKWNEAVRKVKGENFKEQFNFYKMNYEDGTYIDDLDIDTALKQETAETFENAFKKLSNDYKNLNKKGDASSIGNTPETKIAKIVEAFGDDVKLINTADMLTQRGIQNIASKIPNLFAISLSSYGAGTPKNNSGFRAYNSELGLLSNNLIKDIQGDGITGFSKYVTEAKKQYQYENKAKKLGKTVEELTQEEKTKATSTQAQGGEKLTKVQTAKAEKDAMRNYLYDLGGARFQSFSDAQIEEVFDILQLITDCASNDFPLQLYSKEFWEHRVLGQMGVKQNMSLISLIFDNGDDSKVLAGLRKIKSLEDSTSGITIVLETDANGNVVLENEMPKIVEIDADGNLINPPKHYAFYETVFADYETHKNANIPEYVDGTPIQSHGYKDAIALQMLKAYSKNVGTIAIGFSDAHIIAMLRDKRIRMVIPYHASGMTEGFAKPLKIDSANDYTEVQSAKPKIEDFDELKAKIVRLYPDKADSIIDKLKKDLTFSFKFNKVMQEVKDARAAVEIYKKECYKKKTKYFKKVKVGDVNYEINVNVNYSNIPAFEKFINEENYYKLLADFNCYDAIDESFAQQHGVQVINKETGEIYYPQGLKDSAELIEYVNRLKGQKIFKGDAESVIKALESNSFAANIKSKDDYVKYVSLAMQNMSEILETEVKNKGEMYSALDEKFADVEKDIMNKIAENHKNDEENMPYKIAEAKAEEKAKKKSKKANLLTEEVDTSKKKTNIVSLIEEDGKASQYEHKFDAVKVARYIVQVTNTNEQKLADGAIHKVTTNENKGFDSINQVAIYTLKRYFDKTYTEGVSAKTLNNKIAELIKDHNTLTEKEYRDKINDMIDSYIKLTAIESVATSILEEASITKESVNLEFIYENAKKYLDDNGYTDGKNQKTILTKIRQELSKAVYGQNTDLSEVSATLKKLRQDAINQAEIYRQKNQLFVKARQLGEMLASKDNPKVVNEIASNEAFKKALKGVKNISLWKGEISKPNIQKFLNFMNEWFNPANEGMAELFVAEREGASLSSTDADARDRIINGEYGLLKLAMYNLNAYFNRSTYNPYERLTIEFVDNAKTLLAQSYKLFKDFNARMFGDKKIKIKEIANEIYVEQSKTNIINGAKKISLIKTAFGQMVDPRTYFLMLTGNNPNSEFMQMFNQLQKDEVACVNKFHELTAPITSMLNDKNYSKHFSKDTIELKTKNGTILLTVNQAMDLFLMAGQEDAQEGLKVNGFSYKDIHGNKKKVEGVNVYDILGGTETLEDGSTVEHKGLAFTEEDKKFMEAIKLMYSQLTEIKAKADLDIYFMTNIVANYYPLRREGDAFSKIIGMNPNRFVQTIYNIASNKDRNKQSTAQLAVGDVYSKAIGQADIMTKYGIIGKDIDTFGRVLGIAFRPNNEGSKTSVIATMKEYDKNAETYINNFLTDLIGNRSSDSFAALKKIRGAWATAQLGFNPKIVMSQLASLPTLYNFYDTSIMGKALITRVDENEMFEHSPYAKARYVENSIFKSESNVEKISSNISKFASKFTMAIQWMDKNVIKTAWAAAKLQVEKDTRLHVGSEEYWQKVDDVFTNSVRLSQPQYSASERSALQRSTNEFAKAVTMFSSVSVKYLSLIVQHIDRVIYNKKQLKLIQEGKIEGNAEALAKTLEKSKKTLATAATSVVVANIMFVLIKKLFDALYNKDDEDEEGNQTFEAWFEDFAKNFGGSMIGMIPLLKEVYNYFVNGYDVENYTYSMVNDVLASTKELTDIIISFSSGEEVPQAKILRNSRNIVYSLSAILGLPVRNATNTITGLISRVSEEFKYGYNNLFNTNPKYASDIQKALDNNDAEMANHIFELYISNKGLEQTSETNLLLADLYAKGYSNVVPKSVGISINYNGDEYLLNNKEIAQFKAIYKGAEKSITNMSRSNLFKQASDETKARAIKMVYDYYYTLSVRDYIDDDNYSKIEMFGEIIPIEKLSIIIKECQSIEGNNKKLEVMKIINRQNLSNAQKYMVLGYLGYSNSNGYNQVLAEIKKLKLSSEKTNEMLKYCGY